jgi:FkbM family methyltransferase
VLVAQKIAGLATRTGVIFDLGANIGLYSLVFAANRKTKVYAFEPFDEALRYLRRNIEDNRLTNIEVHPIVLSDRAGTCRFTFDTVTLCTSHISADGESGVEMPCSDLDSYMERHALPVPDVIKIDVEGADLPVLHGMERLLKRRQTRVFLEGACGTPKATSRPSRISKASDTRFGIWI